MSTQVLESPTAVASSFHGLTVLSEHDALQAATEYVKTHIDPALTVVSSYRSEDKSSPQADRRFYIRCEEGPLAPIHVQKSEGQVAPFTADEIRVIREKAAILQAQKEGIVPRDEKGVILSEYAKRQARSYLADSLGMYFDADDPLYVAEDLPVWQVTIRFKQYSTGPFTLGVMDVDASTGEVIPLDDHYLNRIQERLRAIIRSQA